MFRPLAGAGAVALASAGIVAPQPATALAQAPGPAQVLGPVVVPVQPAAYTAGPAPAPVTPAPAPAAAPIQRRLVVFGDSVANRQSCHCESFVTRYAQLVRDKATVHVDNLAGDGQTTTSVLRVLARPAARELVREADTVVFVAGANDYHRAFDAVGRGRSSAGAYRFVARRVQDNLVRAIRTVTRINPKAKVLSFDYWNAFKDGDVARSTYTPRQRQAALAATESANSAIRQAAAQTASSFVSSKQAFAAAGSLTPLLAADGDHPSRAGNDLLAHTLADAIWVK